MLVLIEYQEDVTIPFFFQLMKEWPSEPKVGAIIATYLSAILPLPFEYSTTKNKLKGRRLRIANAVMEGLKACYDAEMVDIRVMDVLVEMVKVPKCVKAI